MSLISQSEWNQVRIEILAEAAIYTELAHDNPALFNMLEALTRAYDKPAPVYSVYRKLGSFKAGQWPLIRKLIVNVESHSPTEQKKFEDLLVRVTSLLDKADANRDVLTETLEIELEVLKTLLDELG